jgi:hypothetical protein
LESLALDCLPEAVLDSLQPFGSMELPIHPSLARHFDLGYATEETRYRVSAKRKSTFAEYLNDYVTFA